MGRGVNSWRIGREVRTEGVVTGRVRSLSSRSGQTPHWPRISEVPLQAYRQVHLCYALVLGSLSGLPVMSGGVFVSPRKGIFCVRKMMRNDRRRSNRGTTLRSTNDCRLLGKCRLGLGAHTSLDLARGWCIYLLAIIGMIAGDKMSVAVRGF